MSMKEIREKFDVPAKRGMTVKPKSGYNQGLLGYIRGSSGNMLVVIGFVQVWLAVQIGRALRAGWRWCRKAVQS